MSINVLVHKQFRSNHASWSCCWSFEALCAFSMQQDLISDVTAHPPFAASIRANPVLICRSQQLPSDIFHSCCWRI